jgi:hypothetical protein
MLHAHRCGVGDPAREYNWPSARDLPVRPCLTSRPGAYAASRRLAAIELRVAQGNNEPRERSFPFASATGAIDHNRTVEVGSLTGQIWPKTPERP